MRWINVYELRDSIYSQVPDPDLKEKLGRKLVFRGDDPRDENTGTFIGVCIEHCEETGTFLVLYCIVRAAGFVEIVHPERLVKWVQ